MKNYSKREANEYNWLRALLHYVSIYFILIPFFKLYWNVKVEGAENIPKGESFIVAANHLSVYDPVIVSMAIKKPIAFMAKKELFEESPKMRFWIDLYGAFSVNRKNLEIATIRTVKDVISTKNWVLGIFPQSSRDIPSEITNVTPGFAYLSKLTNTKILPVSIITTDLHRPKLFKGQLTVKISKPLIPCTNIDYTMKQWTEEIVKKTNYNLCLDKHIPNEIKSTSNTPINNPPKISVG